MSDPDEGEPHQLSAPGKPGEIASSLATQRAGQLVLIDQKGAVMTAARVRVRRLVGFGVVVGGFGAAGYLWAGWMGATSLSVGAAIGVVLGSLGRSLRQPRAILKVGGLIELGRTDEAAAMLAVLEKRRGLFPSARANIEWLWASVERQRGDLEAAALRLEAGLEICRARPRTLRAQRWMFEFYRAGLLAARGRLDEAVATRAALDGALAGDGFRRLQRSVDLSLAFHLGSADRLPDDLHDWARDALGMNLSGAQLALLAWAFEARGDRDMAEHLLREAPERMGAANLVRSHPALARWIDERRAAWNLD